MPKYEALVLLYSRSKECYIQIGEVFELDNPEVERLHLEAGQIRPAVEKPVKSEAKPEMVKAETTAEHGGSKTKR